MKKGNRFFFIVFFAGMLLSLHKEQSWTTGLIFFSTMFLSFQMMLTSEYMIWRLKKLKDKTQK